MKENDFMRHLNILMDGTSLADIVRYGISDYGKNTR